MKISEIQTNNPLALIDDGVFYHRKFSDYLAKWKQDKLHKPLVVKGLRQSGKTKTLLYFAAENYQSVIYLDFRNHPDYAKFFIDYEINNIKERLSAAFGFTNFIDHNMLIIFDEIQDCPIARGSLKNFAIDGRYDVICSGSMLGLSGYNDDMEQYIPAGYEEIKKFYPMDFEEFLRACGYSESLLDLLRGSLDKRIPIDESVHRSLLKLFRLYIIVGGMPAAVRKYLDTHDLTEVRKTQRSLIDSYRDDFGTHLKGDGNIRVKAIENAKINRILDCMPAQLSKQSTTKFVYKLLPDSHAKAEKYEGAIQWLIDYGLLIKCENLSKIDTVQAGYATNNQFKLYFADTGLFCSQLDPSIARAVLLDEYDSFKGVVYENIVADALYKSGKSLYYFSIDSMKEIDFITKFNQFTALTEVKAKPGKTRSADDIIKSLPRPEQYIVLKLSSQNIGVVGHKITIPYYLASFLPDDNDALKDIDASLPEIHF